MKLTEKQTQVLDALKAAATPMSAYELLDELREDGFRAPPQVYRALTKLTETGQVHRLESLNAFIACGHSHCHQQTPSVFLICQHCKQVDELQNDSLRQGLAEVTQHQAFTLTQAVIELTGTCEQCEQELD